MAANARLLIEVQASLGTFQSDLGRAAAIAEANARKIERTFDGLKRSIATALGGLVGGLSAGAIVAYARDTIAAASALDDLSDVTGSSVEALSRLANQAKISGVDFNTLEGLVTKLAAGMAGADDESSNVGRALRYLGVEARDPAVALNEIALKLDQFKDGIGKAALARDLFGRGGPAFLAALKDIAEAQDVAATVTAKQAAEAEALEKALRTLSVESTAFANVVLSGIVPALNTMFAEMREGIRIAGSLGSAIATLGTINPFKNVAENLADVDRRIADIMSGESTVETRWARALGVSDELLRKLKIQREFLQFQQRNAAMAGAAALGYTGDVRDYLANKKPAADYTGGADKPGKTKTAREAISEAERYLASLQRQLDATRELTVYDKTLNDLLSGRLELSGQVSAAEILRLAQEIDGAAALKKAKEDETRAREAASQAVIRAQESARSEVEKAAESNAALRDEIDLIGKGARERSLIAIARNESTIALKEETVAMLENSGGNEALIALYKQEIRLLQERSGLMRQKGEIEQVADEAKKAREFVESLGLAFASAFEDAVVKGSSLRDVLKGLEQDIIRIFQRKLVTEPLMGWLGGLFDSQSGSGGLNFGAIAAKLAGLFAGGGGEINPYGFSGTGFAAGTPFAPGGPALVGERGPEIVNLPRGAQVIPNHRIGGGLAPVVNISVHQAAGASRASSEQLAAETGRAVQRALRSVR